MSKEPVSVIGARGEVVAEVVKFGFTYREEAQYDLTLVVPDNVIQVRRDSNIAPRESVQSYTQQIKGGALFPPIIVTSDHVRIDGTTRAAAYLAAGQKHCTAMVLDISWASADDHERKNLTALAAALNQMGAARLTAAEVRSQVRVLLELDWSVDRIQQTLGASPTRIADVKREIVAENRLRQVDYDINGDLKETALLRALGRENVCSLNDAPYKALAKLAVEAAFSAPEVSAAAKEVRAQPSETAQLELIQRIETDNSERIRERRLTGRSGKPSPANMLRQRLGFILKYAGNERALTERNPTLAANHLAVVNQAVKVLSEVATQQGGGAAE